MDSELEKNQEQKAADQTTGNSESYGRAAGNYQREYRSVTGRPQRPRIHTQRPYNAERQQASNDSQGGGFLPEGFGAGLQGASGNNSYQQRQQGGEGSFHGDHPFFAPAGAVTERIQEVTNGNKPSKSGRGGGPSQGRKGREARAPA